MSGFRTTHIGSLPFTNLEDALNYTFLFDLPCLFTLPKVSSEYLMGADLVQMLGLGKMLGDKLVLDKKIKDVSKVSFPVYFDQFKSRLNGSDFKYQLIGPYSLKHYLSYYGYHFSMDELMDLYLTNISHFFKMMINEGMSLCFLDEPFLDKLNTSELSKYKEFYNSFKNDLAIETGIHCCSKLSINQIETLGPMDIQLDSSLYLNSKIYLKSIKYICIPLVMDELPQIIGQYYSSNKINGYITPTCGLAAVQIPNLFHIISDLEASKAKLLSIIS